MHEAKQFVTAEAAVHRQQSKAEQIAHALSAAYRIGLPEVRNSIQRRLYIMFIACFGTRACIRYALFLFFRVSIYITALETHLESFSVKNTVNSYIFII